MINHKVRMLGVELQQIVSKLDGPKIAPTLSKIAVELGGQEVPEHWPSAVQLTYVLALIIQHIPSGFTTPPGDSMAWATRTVSVAELPPSSALDKESDDT